MAVNATVTEDEQTLAGETVRVPVAEAEAGENGGSVGAFEGGSVRALLGRGPGVSREGVVGGGGD